MYKIYLLLLVTYNYIKIFITPYRIMQKSNNTQKRKSNIIIQYNSTWSYKYLNIIINKLPPNL